MLSITLKLEPVCCLLLVFLCNAGIQSLLRTYYTCSNALWTFVCVLLLVGMELIFFIAVSMVVYFGFMTKTALKHNSQGR